MRQVNSEVSISVVLEELNVIEDQVPDAVVTEIESLEILKHNSHLIGDK